MGRMLGFRAQQTQHNVQKKSNAQEKLTYVWNSKDWRCSRSSDRATVSETKLSVCSVMNVSREIKRAHTFGPKDSVNIWAKEMTSTRRNLLRKLVDKKSAIELISNLIGVRMDSSHGIEMEDFFVLK